MEFSRHYIFLGIAIMTSQSWLSHPQNQKNMAKTHDHHVLVHGSRNVLLGNKTKTRSWDQSNQANVQQYAQESLRWTLVIGVHSDHSDISGRWTGLVGEKFRDVGFSKVTNCPENESLIFNICPIDFYYLSSDPIFKCCQKKYH